MGVPLSRPISAWLLLRLPVAGLTLTLLLVSLLILVSLLTLVSLLALGLLTRGGIARGELVARRGRAGLLAGRVAVARVAVGPVSAVGR